MTVQLNGEPRTFATIRTVADLVAQLGLPQATLLVELNGRALRREEWESAGLNEADRVEVLRIAAGG